MLTPSNMASQVMWHQLMHLVFYNAVIGVIEATLLVR